MKLYTFFRSGTSHRLRIALNLKGLACEQIAVDLRREQHLTADYKAINPQQLVPALEVEGRVMVQSPAIIGTLGSDARCGAPDPHYRHAMPVLAPIESCRRARSSGVGCAKIAHMNRTVAASNSVNVSTALTIADLLRWRRTRSNVPGARAWTVEPAGAVVAHRQAPRRATPRQPAPSESGIPTSRP